MNHQDISRRRPFRPGFTRMLLVEVETVQLIGKMKDRTFVRVKVGPGATLRTSRPLAISVSQAA